MRLYVYAMLALTALLLFTNCTDTKKKKSTETETEQEIQDSNSETNTTSDDIDVTVVDVSVPHHYICYTNDDDPSMKMSIAFDAASHALYVKYQGQNDSIPLDNVKEEHREDGAYPTITQFYDEMHQGKKNGTYELTHSGNWDYALYRRLKDNKVFKFTIDHDATVVGGTYRETPCY